MSAKRDYDDVDEGEISDDEPSPKRPRRLTGAQSRHRHQHSAIDPTWGQKYVFSNKGDATTIPYGEESDFEHDAEAMAYLRSVRYVFPAQDFLLNTLPLLNVMPCHRIQGSSDADKLYVADRRHMAFLTCSLRRLSRLGPSCPLSCRDSTTMTNTR